MRMRDALALGRLTVADEPLTSVTAREFEGYAKFGLGDVIAKDIILLALALVRILRVHDRAIVDI